MSDSSITTLYAIAAIAIYQKMGVAEAIDYLQRQGYTFDEATNVMALYDKYCEMCDKGMQHILLNSPKHG